MSVLLKLTGITSYTSPLILNAVLQKGETIRLSDDVAGKIGGSRRTNDEGEPVLYFTEVENVTPKYDQTLGRHEEVKPTAADATLDVLKFQAGEVQEFTREELNGEDEASEQAGEESAEEEAAAETAAEEEEPAPAVAPAPRATQRRPAKAK